MKKISKRLVSLALALVLLMGLFAVPMGQVSAASAKNNWVTSYSNPDINGDGTIKILLIGNSYGNNVRNMLGHYLSTQSKKVVVGAEYIGFSGMYDYVNVDKGAEFYATGYNTTEVTDNPDIYGSPKFSAQGYQSSVKYRDAVKITNWDIIMLQESPYGAARASTYTTYLNTFVKNIKSAYSEAHGTSAKMSMCWFMTWATPASLASGDGYYVGTNLDQFNRISTCVNDYVAASGLFDVIYPAATMIQNARTADPDNYVIASETKYDGICTDNLHVVTVFGLDVIAYGFTKTLGLSTDGYDTENHLGLFMKGDEVPEEFQVEPEKSYRANRAYRLLQESVDNALKTPQTVTQSKFTGDVKTTCNDGTNHTYKTPVVTAPTCTEGGHTLKVCSKCNYNYVYDKLEKLGHSYKVTSQQEATCTQNGYINQYCTRCNEQNNQTIPGGHTYGNWTVVKAATRTETGIKRKTCTVCGDYYEETIPLVTDNKTYDVAFETQSDYDTFCADVIKASNTKGLYATDDYHYFDSKDKAYRMAYVTNDTMVNVANSLVAIKNPDNAYPKTFTMLAGGGYSYTSTTAAPGVILGHDNYGYYGVKVFVGSSGTILTQYFYMTEPTAADNGYSTVIANNKNDSLSIVAMDGKSVTPFATINKSTYPDLPIDAISQNNNNQQFFNYKFYVTGDASGNTTLKVDLIYDDLISQFTATTETLTFNVDIAKEMRPSADHSNYTAAFGFFKHSYGGQLTYMDAKGETVNHDHDSRVYSIYAEYQEKAACTHTSTTTVAAVEATCTEAGTTAAVVCTACNKTISGGETVAALGHDLTTTVTKAATCTETGASTTACSRCDYSNAVALPALGHTMTSFTVTKEATCTAAGVKSGTCSTCGVATTESIPALGHNYGSFVTTQAATCTEAGVKTQTCANCNGVITAEIPALGHSYGAWVVTKEPTETEDGSKYRTCSTCGNVQTVTVPKDSASLVYDWDFSSSADYAALKLNARTVANKSLANATWDGAYSSVGYVSGAKAVGFNTSLNNGTAGFVLNTPTAGGAEAQPVSFKLEGNNYIPSTVASTTQVGTAMLPGIIFAKNDTGYFVFQATPSNVNMAFQPYSSDTSEAVILSGTKKVIMSNQVMGAESFSINGVEQAEGLTTYSARYTYLGYFTNLISDLITNGKIGGSALPTSGTADYYSRFSVDYDLTIEADNTINLDYTLYYTSDNGDVVALNMYPIVLSDGIATYHKSANSPTEVTRDFSEYLTDLSPIVPVFGAVTYPTQIQSATAYATVETIYAEYAEACSHANTTVLDAKAATCTEEGQSKCVYCADCGQLLSGTIGGGKIAALGHDYQSSVTSEPKCNADGTLTPGTLTYACTRCDDYYDVAIKAAHTFSDWTITTAATSTTVGSKQCSCTSCGVIVTKEIPATTTFEYDWDYTAVAAGQKDADDTMSIVEFMDTGSGSVSGDDYHEYNSDNGSFDFITPQGRYMVGLINNPAGYNAKSFSVKAYAETYSGVSPTPGIIVATDGNETTPTYYLLQITLNSGVSTYNLVALKRSASKNSNGHYGLTTTNIATNVKIGQSGSNFNTMSQYISSRVTKYGQFYHMPVSVQYDVTVNTNGSLTINPTMYLHSTDGSGKTAEIDFTDVIVNNTLLGLDSDATFTPVFGIATRNSALMADYESTYPALINGKEDRCMYEFVNATYSIDGDSPEHTHTYDSGTTVAATCTTGGYTKYTCTVCGGSYKENETAALGHNLSTTTTAATCTTAGATVTSCSRCSYKDTVTLPALGHTFSNPTVTKEATCTEEGTMSGTCSVCGSTTTQTIPATGHSYGDWIVDKEATTTSKGSQHKTCSACGDTVTEEIPIIIITSGYNLDFEGSNGSANVSTLLANGTHYVSTNKNTTASAEKLTAQYNATNKAFELAVPSSMFYNINGVVVNQPANTIPMSFETVVGCTGRVAANALYTGGVVYAQDDTGIYYLTLAYNGAFKHYGYYTNTTALTDSSDGYKQITYASTTTTTGINGVTPHFKKAIKNGEVVADSATGLNTGYLENYAKLQANVATDLPTTLTLTELAAMRTKYDVQVEDGAIVITASVIFTTADNTYEFVFSPVEVAANGTHSYVNNHLTPTYSYVDSGVTTAAGYTPAFGVIQRDRTSADTAVQVYSLKALYNGGDGEVEGGGEGGGDTTCEHNYAAEVTAPTCTTEGFTTYTCSLCGDTYKGAATAALGHDLSTTTVAATCTTAGSTTSTCSRCDYTNTVAIAATGHNFSNPTVTKEATCTEAGVQTGTCTACGETTTETIPATGHTESGWIVDKAATETEAGSKHTECTVCGETMQTATIPATGSGSGGDSTASDYNWDLSNADDAADALANATHVVASKGGTTTSDTLTVGYDSTSAALELTTSNAQGTTFNGLFFNTPAGGTPTAFNVVTGTDDAAKTYNLFNAAVAYAEDDTAFYGLQLTYFSGFKFYHYEIKKSSLVASADGYEQWSTSSYGRAINAVAPVFETMTKNGEALSTVPTGVLGNADVMKAMKTEYDVEIKDGVVTIIASAYVTVGSDEYVFIAKPVTISNGAITYNGSSTASYTVGENYENFFGVFSAWTGGTTMQLYSVEANYGLGGGEGDDTHEHSYTSVVTAPTCTAAGYTTYTCECGDSYVGDTVAALGHDTTTETVDATCETAGSVTTTCSRCDYKNVETIAALGHDTTTKTVDATCETAGSVTTTCSRCDYSNVETIAALGHDETTVTVDATCTEAGSTTTSCSRCDYENVVTIPATGHTESDWIVDKAATETEAGSKHTECTVCGETIKTATIPATGADEETVVGDANGDGAVTVNDSVLIARFASGTADFTEEQLAALDVNGDGDVNVIDAILISRFSAGLITEFPASK